MNTQGSLAQVVLSRVLILAITTLTLAGLKPAQAQTAYLSGYRGASMAPQPMPYPAGYGYAQPQAYARPVAMRPIPRAMPVPQQQVMVRRAIPVAPPAVAAAAGGYLSFNGKYAAAPGNMPAPVRVAVSAGNNLQSKPYQRGGGHRSVEDNAYDCSGSVSYCLIKAGLLARPLSSKEFARYGEAGPGRFITIYVKPGEHVFMSICGLRFDTTGGFEGQGPRWRPTARSMAGFQMRHPFGL
jgi:hypothetical protein